MQIVDTHCHLHFDDFGDSLQEVYQNALNAGVTRLVTVGTTLADSRQAVKLAGKSEKVWAAVGVHPHEAEDYLASRDSSLALEKLLAAPKVVAIGEIGLDFYKNHSPKIHQEKALRSQIELALPLGLPFIFHVRDAWSDFWRIYDDYKSITGVIHSFSSGPKQLDAALERGLYVGLNGIMTFTKDEAQLQAARRAPLERLMLETDAPFLTPEPYRGQQCEPKHTVATARFLSKLRSESLQELTGTTTTNAIKVFKLDEK